MQIKWFNGNNQFVTIGWNVIAFELFINNVSLITEIIIT